VKPQGVAVGMETKAAITEWAELFNAGRFFEAHEVLERPWLRAAEPERTFLKGLIHAAVALHHFGNGNSHGARVKSRSARGYLEAYAPRFGGVEVGKLVAALEAYFAPLRAENPSMPSGSPPRVILYDLDI
jgi:uncharacterized protein